ncbi:MAG: tautomerase family protein [Hyphomicrobium sp.]
MPLLRIDVYKGRNESDLKKLLDVIHNITVEVFNIPPRDRYQIINEHSPEHLIVQDSGLNIPRTKDFVMIQVTTRKRSQKMKETFYSRLAEELHKKCGIAQSDVMINFVTCGDEDWSFGNGRAQFLINELS